jgi:GTP-binding protein
MIVKSAEFITSAAKPDQYPPPGTPEIAFAGRSNVGKSTLINSLVNRQRLVKTSNTPGRTQLINFFAVNAAFHFVDLPGYGYARVPAAIQRQWGPMIEAYLSTRRDLKGLILLVDIRRTPAREEHDLIHWLNHHHLPFRVVATKADKLSRNQRVRPLRDLAAALGLATEDLIPFSAKTRLGRDLVWQAVTELLARLP